MLVGYVEDLETPAMISELRTASALGQVADERVHVSSEEIPSLR